VLKAELIGLFGIF